MSAFMVNETTMNAVVSAILEHCDHFGETVTYHGTQFEQNAATTIGRKLFLMNRRALNYRYPAHTHPLPEYDFEPSETSPVERFKAMQCLMYQCDEGKVPDCKLYKELDATAGKLAQKIVEASAEWEAAPWGF